MLSQTRPLYKRTSSRKIHRENARRILIRLNKELETLRENAPMVEHSENVNKAILEIYREIQRLDNREQSTEHRGT